MCKVGVCEYVDLCPGVFPNIDICMDTMKRIGRVDGDQISLSLSPFFFASTVLDGDLSDIRT